MEWMANRLAEIRRRPIELARHLGIQPPRVYEMLAGKRKLQRKEMAPAAAFLEWPVNVVMDLAKGMALDVSVPVGSSIPSALYDLPRNLPIRAARLLVLSDRGEFALGKGIIDYARRFPRLTNRTDVFGVYMQGGDMAPWREAGQLCLCEENRPPRDGDYVLIEIARGRKDGHANVQADEARAMVKRLVKSSPTMLRLQQYQPADEFNVPRNTVARIYRVMLWEEIIS